MDHRLLDQVSCCFVSLQFLVAFVPHCPYCNYQAELNMGIGLRVYTGPDTPAWVYAEGVFCILLISMIMITWENKGARNQTELLKSKWALARLLGRCKLPILPRSPLSGIIMTSPNIGGVILPSSLSGTLFWLHPRVPQPSGNPPKHHQGQHTFHPGNLLFWDKLYPEHFGFQAMYGSTGDLTPWHGFPICPDSFPDCYLDGNSEEVKITDQWPSWLSFWNTWGSPTWFSTRNTSRRSQGSTWYWTEGERWTTGTGRTSQSTGWSGGWQAMVTSSTPRERRRMNIWLRWPQSVFHHCAQARGDVNGYQIRIRGENSDDTTEDG